MENGERRGGWGGDMKDGQSRLQTLCRYEGRTEKDAQRRTDALVRVSVNGCGEIIGEMIGEKIGERIREMQRNNRRARMERPAHLRARARTH